MGIQPSLWIDLSETLRERPVISFSLDYSGRLFVLATEQKVDYRKGTSVRLKTTTPHDFVVIEATEDYVTEYRIPDQYWNYHHVQPLPDDELLLVCSRALFRRRDDFDLNGRVFSLDGKFKREFLLGDGIAQVQTTQDGTIWTSYFDEGVFGNFGWSANVGESGLIQWDQNGNQLYTFKPVGGIDMIADCYAMNTLSSTETWVCYYTEFPLVRIVKGRVVEFWNSPARGSNAFAVLGRYVVFCGTYEDRLLHLYELKTKSQMIHLADFDLLNASDFVFTRSNRIVIERELQFYQLDISELIRAV
jgi:hypothetical protein